jgi:hypothetical protein
MRWWDWVLLILAALIIHWISLYPSWVETYYTYGIYPFISTVQRFLLGWIPFSIGDLFYAFLIIVIIIRFFQLLKAISKRKITRLYMFVGLRQVIFIFNVSLKTLSSTN